jgi:carbamoyl-phosphate synthase large subunit
LKMARDLHRMGFRLLGTSGTADFCTRAKVPVQTVCKVGEGSPNVVDLIKAGEIQLIVNTPYGSQAHGHGTVIRTTAIRHGVPLMTTLSAAQAAVRGISALLARDLDVCSLQQHYAITSGSVPPPRPAVIVEAFKNGVTPPAEGERKPDPVGGRA